MKLTPLQNQRSALWARDQGLSNFMAPQPGIAVWKVVGDETMTHVSTIRTGVKISMLGMVHCSPQYSFCIFIIFTVF